VRKSPGGDWLLEISFVTAIVSPTWERQMSEKAPGYDEKDDKEA
jgi:hypothetical protein